MLIAVDFDGTIVEHKYPAIGKEKIFAFQTLKALQKQGHLLVLWTIRSGKLLDEAVEYCRKNGVEFYAVNRTYPEEVIDETMSRKVNADVFIDDRNVGGFIGWGEIWQQLNKDASTEDKDAYRSAYDKAKRKTFCGFIQNLFCGSKEL
ncbi:BT0820 family HAD-type phosphatase [Carboxylicivirga linearis]|uniref:Hydrolase n=1 Tax=Carboxylicivirga linearis TaxID=1628157 RepID=A0ABS5JSP3_9BACT|nr:hydrolase [Carboxylicivirga linearis]MBS2097915.1 hydrolase [Carboxylicivirga linearis]